MKDDIRYMHSIVQGHRSQNCTSRILLTQREPNWEAEQQLKKLQDVIATKNSF